MSRLSLALVLLLSALTMAWVLVRGTAPDPPVAVAVGHGPVDGARHVVLTGDQPKSVEPDDPTASEPERDRNAVAAITEVPVGASSGRSRRRYELRGRVVDETGAPVVAFAIQLWRNGARQRTEWFEHADGRFAVGDLEAGYWDVVPDARAHLPSYGEEVRVPSKDLELAVVRCGIVSVRVTDPGGAPVAGASVRARSMNPPPYTDPRSELVRTDAGGRATLPDVRLGAFRVEASSTAFAGVESEPLQLTAGQRELDVRVALSHGGRIEGTLRDVGGAPAGGIALWLRAPEGALDQERTTAADGSFAFDHVAAGRYSLSTQPRDEQALRVPRQRLELDVSEGETTVAEFADLRGSLVRLTGVVTRDGEPLWHARLSIVGGPRGAASRGTETNAAGEFAAVLDGPGDHAIHVSPREPRLGDSSVRFRVRVPPSPAFHVDLEYRTGGLSGRVSTSAGEPARGRSFALVAVDGSARATATADDEGRYRLEAVPEGSYSIRPVGSVEIVAGRVHSGHDVRVPVLAAIAGVVRGPRGEPIAAVEVTWRGSDEGLQVRARTDVEGRFLLEGVDPGPGHVRAVRGASESAWVEVVAPVGEHAPMELVLDAR